VSINFDKAEEVFDSSIDFTVGIEEEFALLDPQSLDLVPGFEKLQSAASSDAELKEAICGELISSEIEITSGAGVNLDDALKRQRSRRRKLFELAAAEGLSLAATGTHPWADYREQAVIDTAHYHRVENELKYVAWRNNTFSLHVHVGVNGIDRAVKVCDRLREKLPLLLAISANSPFIDGRDSGLHSARTQTFTKSFPRCGVPDLFGSWQAYRSYLELLQRVGSVEEFTQVWWSVRPHFAYGTVEVRICDAQSTAEESEALESLIAASIVQAVIDVDEGRPSGEQAPRLIEENMWRAIRYGLDGEMVDFEKASQYPARECIDRLMEWTVEARGQISAKIDLPVMNGAQRQRKAYLEQSSLREIFRRSVEETKISYQGYINDSKEPVKG